MADQTLETLADIQSMIDIMSERLVALRALRLQEFIKDEIRSLEGKLLKQFWEQLMVKSRDPDVKNQSLYQSYPSLSKWLVIVGVSEGAKQKITAKLISLEALMSLSDNEISKFLDGLPNDKEDVRKVCAALSLLRNFNKTKKSTGYWDSWKKGTSTNENGCESDSNASGVDHNENLQMNSKTDIRDQSENYPSSSQGTSQKSLPRFNTTEELHSTQADVFPLDGHRTLPHANTSNDVFISTRPAKSHVRQSSGPVLHKTRPPTNSSSSAHLNSSVEKIPTKKTKKRPGSIEIRDTMLPDFVDMLRPNSATGIRKPSQTTSSHNSSSGSPMSPRTPLTPIVPQFPIYPGQEHQPQQSKPRYNRFRAFKDKIKDKMGLKRHKSEEHVDDMADKIQHKHRSDTCPDANTLITAFDRDDTDLNISSAHIAKNLSRINTESTLEGDNLLLQSYRGSREDLTNSTVLVDPRTSVSSEGDTRVTPDESEDNEEAENIKMRKGLMRQSSTMSGVHEEWDVPWEELVFQDPIGQGRVGTVYKGKWHGEVAIRVIDVYHNDEQKLRAFKEEVTLYKKTRHDNIELFMGSSINLPKLAIVTSYCRGKSLYQYIRASKDHVNLNNAKIIAQHIAQGMGYLHSRGIVHKDLKSKNVFINGNRVTITDFGILGLHQISSKSIVMKTGTLQIPDGWLCYMAPEIIRALHVPNTKSFTPPSLPYTKESDMYAFGTVWYELLTSAWPFQGYSPESIIWQVGNGRKQSLSHFQGSKEVKDILMACWAGDPSQRQEFTDSGVMGQLLRLPQAKIIRRSSQPIKTNKKGNKHGGIGTGDRMFDLSMHSVIHELAE